MEKRFGLRISFDLGAGYEKTIRAIEVKCRLRRIRLALDGFDGNRVNTISSYDKIADHCAPVGEGDRSGIWALSDEYISIAGGRSTLCHRDDSVRT